MVQNILTFTIDNNLLSPTEIQPATDKESSIFWNDYLNSTIGKDEFDKINKQNVKRINYNRNRKKRK